MGKVKSVNSLMTYLRDHHNIKIRGVGKNGTYETSVIIMAIKVIGTSIPQAIKLLFRISMKFWHSMSLI